MSRPTSGLSRSLLAETADLLRGTNDQLYSLVQRGLIDPAIEGWKVVEDLADRHDLAQCNECSMWLDVGEIVDGTCELCIGEWA